MTNRVTTGIAGGRPQITTYYLSQLSTINSHVLSIRLGCLEVKGSPVQSGRSDQRPCRSALWSVLGAAVTSHRHGAKRRAERLVCKGRALRVGPMTTVCPNLPLGTRLASVAQGRRLPHLDIPSPDKTRGGAPRSMADDLRAFDGWFYAWPSAPCPVCKLGDLHPNNESIKNVTTTDYDRNKDDEAWEPDWEYGFFHGILYCARPACAEKVIVSGEYRVVESQTEAWVYYDQFRLRYAIPALPLAVAPPDTPKAIVDEIERASRIVWADPAGAANALRRAVEALLDYQHIKKTKMSQSKRRYMSAHERINIFKAKEPKAAASMEAVKWLGNAGSHDSAVLTSTHCVESAEYLNHALKLLYDKSDIELSKRVKVINKAKGLQRTRRQSGKGL